MHPARFSQQAVKATAVSSDLWQQHADHHRYMCEAGTKFVGCCMADPCTNGCHGDSLRPAGRSTALDSQSPGGSCGGQTPFWTCEQAPTFWYDQLARLTSTSRLIEQGAAVTKTHA
jgi:hypothetical protein